MASIRCDVNPPVAELVLDRPEEANTFNAELLAELAEATAMLATAPEVRVVVLRGSGKTFCHGASVDMFLHEPRERRASLLRVLVTDLHQAVTRLARLPVPVLGVAHGTTVGGGLSLLAACDVVLATETSQFRMAWSGIGITMDAAATWTLPRIIGPHRTLELIYTNRIFTAAEAHAWGLVNWLVPEDELHARTAELTGRLASAATGALGACKRLVHDGASASFETHMEDEAEALVRVIASADADEGFKAFRERRRPQFQGL